jgi:MFS family permease
MVVLPLWQDYHFFIQGLPHRVGTAYPDVMYSGRKIASTNPMNVQIANFESQKSSPAPKSRNTAIVVLSSCIALQMTSFVIILPLFARRFTELGAGVEALGISEMAYALTSALAAPFMGALADRIGRRPIVLISLAAYAAVFCGYLIAPSGVALTLGELTLGRLSDWLGRKPIILIGLMLFSAQFLGLTFFRHHLQIAAAFVIAGLGSALFNPALSVSYLDISPIEHRARILGIQSMVGSCGNILGPALVAMFSSAVSARSIFLVSVGVVLLAILILLADQARERNIKKESVRIPAA